MGNIELHFHVLPGIDDGPSSLEESVELARVAATDGTDTIVATPHVSPKWATDVSTLDDRLRQLVERLRSERVPVRLLRGGELDHEMVARLSQQELDLIAQGPPGKRWLLLEAPFVGFDRGFEAAADELRARGFAVLVAHPERAFLGARESCRVLERELAAGSAIQLNAWSLTGLYGECVRTTSLGLLRRSGRVAVASDAHGAARSPSLRRACDALEAFGVHSPERFTDAIPRALLGRGLSALPVAEAA
jgi:protein-tyrosine phosphatase